jgi:hypothetical protein
VVLILLALDSHETRRLRKRAWTVIGPQALLFQGSNHITLVAARVAVDQHLAVVRISD